MDADGIATAVCPPLDATLVGQLVAAFSAQEQRFLLGDHQPSTVNGGQFCEAAARILYHADFGTLDLSRDVDGCLKHVEDSATARPHSYPDIASARQIARVIRSIYKVRSSRGAVHLSATYTANELDSRLVLDSCRWILPELLRSFWPSDRTEELASVARDIVQFESPLVAVFDESPLVLRTDLSTVDEVLVVLLWHGSEGASRHELGTSVKKSPSSITRALQQMTNPRDRRVVKLSNGQYRVTPLGVKSLRSAGTLTG